METSAMFDNNYARYYDRFNEDKPYQREIEFVYNWAGKPESIFDIGCGTASYWKYYPENTRLVGIDKSEPMADTHPRVICADVMHFKTNARFDCATALYDVLNYIPSHDWWPRIPVNQGGYFIFDIWNKKKVLKDGFRVTEKIVGGLTRKIKPIDWDDESVELLVEVSGERFCFEEVHKMYIWGTDDILDFCGSDFEIVEMIDTKTWQTWFKCRKK